MIRAVFFYVILSLSIAGHAQNIQFNHLTTNEGLTTGHVRVAIEDYQGLFWIGSEDGLMSYDGYDIKVYRHDPTDLTSISSNFVLALFEDSFNRLWIGTLDGGVCLYDKPSNTFKRYVHVANDPTSLGYNYVRDFYESADHKLYIGFETGNFSVLQLKEKLDAQLVFENFSIPSKNQKKANWGSTIIQDPQGKVLIGVNGGGIFRFDPKSKLFEPFLKNRLLEGGVQKLLLDSQNRLWISTWSNGLYVYHYETDQLFNFNTQGATNSLNHNQSEALEEDHDGNIWIGTDQGLNMLPAGQDPFTNHDLKSYKHSSRDNSSLLSNAIKDIYADSKNRIWISTYYGGVNIYDKNAYKFNPIRSNQFRRKGLSFNNVVAFVEDNSGNIWIGSDGGGLDRVPNGSENLWSEVYDHIPVIDSKKIKVKCLELDKTGVIWIGTWGQGLLSWNPTTKTKTQYKAGLSDMQISANEVLSIQCDTANNLWIGTFSGGLNYLNTKTGKFKNYPSVIQTSETQKVDKVNHVFIDNSGQVWACPEVGGLCKYNPDTEAFELIANDIVKADLTILKMMQSSDQTLWLGTNKVGVINYDPKTQNSKLYDQTLGLPNNVVKALTQDASSRIWIGSNQGLSVLDTETSRIINYGRGNGVQGNEFNEGFVCRDGMMLFGGTQGMNAFYPENISTDSVMPRVLLTNFWLQNVTYDVRDIGSPLSRNIMVSDVIHLKHDQHSFSLGYAALNYAFDEKSQYAYWLEGFHEDWQSVGTDRKATFTNLEPKSYTFHVKASNSDGLWGENEKTIQIVIHPAWWQTLTFKVCFVLLTVAVVLGYIRYRMTFLLNAQASLEHSVAQRTHEVRKLNQELALSNSELVDQKENLERTVQELSKTRSQLAISERMASLGIFTAGIAHEINNPINFISGAAQKLFDIIAKKTDSHYSKAELDEIGEVKNIMTVGIERTVQIVNSLQNYARNQPDEFENYNVVKCLEDALLILSHKLKTTSIKIIKEYPLSLTVHCAPGRMSQVFTNLISNAMDAMDGYGVISLRMSIDMDDVLFTIADTGSGIHENDMDKLFDPFFSTKEVGKGTGLGLYIVYGIVEEHKGTIQVKPNNPGTIFEIRLPIVH